MRVGTVSLCLQGSVSRPIAANPSRLLAPIGICAARLQQSRQRKGVILRLRKLLQFGALLEEGRTAERTHLDTGTRLGRMALVNAR